MFSLQAPPVHNGVSPGSFGIHAFSVVSILVILSLLLPLFSFSWQCLWGPTGFSNNGVAAELKFKKEDSCTASGNEMRKGAHMEGAAKNKEPGDTVGRRKASAASQRSVSLKGARRGPLRSF